MQKNLIFKQNIEQAHKTGYVCDKTTLLGRTLFEARDMRKCVLVYVFTKISFFIKKLMK